MPQRPLEARDAVGARAKQPEAPVRARLRLRDATDDDVRALVEIVNAAYKPVDWWLFEQLRTDEDGFRAKMRRPGAQSIVCELDGRIAGHVALWLQKDGEWAGAWIELLATALTFQGMGIATVLVEEAERRARIAGFTEMQLDCVRENGLPRYYESLGYAVTREIRGTMRAAKYEWTRVYMRKSL